MKKMVFALVLVTVLAVGGSAQAASIVGGVSFGGTALPVIGAASGTVALADFLAATALDFTSGGGLTPDPCAFHAS